MDAGQGGTRKVLMDAGQEDARKELPPLREGEWATDMCGCCDEPGGLAGCGYAASVPACVYAENLKYQPKHSMCAASNECGSCVSFVATGMAGGIVAAWVPFAALLNPAWPLHLYARMKLRHRYGINGNCCTDCLQVFFCGMCSLCQERREVLMREGVVQGPGNSNPNLGTITAPPAQQNMPNAPQAAK